MKKIIFGLILVVIIASAVGIYYVLTNLDAIVKAAIEKHGTEATQTAVRVDKVHIELTDGSGAINGLTIANPKGFVLPDAFSLGEIRTQINLKSLQEEPYIIEEISIRAPQVFVEINEDKKTNLQELKKKLSVGKPADKPEQGADQTVDSGPRLIIKSILFSDGNIKARVAPLDNKEYDLKMPTLKMNNLGGRKGATPTELANEIIDRLIEQAKKEIKRKGIDAEVDKLKAKAKEKVDAEKAKVKSKLDEEKAKTDAKLDDEKKKAEDKLKGLFK